MLTEKEISLIKKSWIVFRDMDPLIIGDVFYSKLFSENPSLRKMFPKEMDKQYQKLVDMLNIIVARLERMDELTREIQGMAIRHQGYGVKPEHYTMVGKALLWTLKSGLGDKWNEELKQAWIKCYTILSGTMLAATQ